ncbi:hypothetical protein XaplCFBP3122_20940, partial [Xanthomonas arboricola pv. populi]
PLPAHRRGTLSGMDATPEPKRTYLRRVLRWWAGNGPAARPHIICSAVDAFAPLNTFQGDRALELQQRLDVPKPSWSSARCPYRLRDTP